MTDRGHNERSFRLDGLAEDGRKGLAMVAAGEDQSIDGWLAVGFALNEARSLFPADRDFGEWCRSANLSDRMNDHDRAAAMWAAANADQFEEARQRGNPRTIRGIHAKWREIEAEREAEAKRLADDAVKAAVAAASGSDDGNSDAGAGPAQDDTARSDAAGDDAGPQADDADGGSSGESGGEDQDKSDAEGPKPAPDPDAKLRREFRSLTAEAQEDDWIALRGEIGDLRKRVTKQRGEISDLKATIKTLTDGDDMGRKLGNLLRERDTLKGRLGEHMATIKRLEYRLKKIEGQEFTL